MKGKKKAATSGKIPAEKPKMTVQIAQDLETAFLRAHKGGLLQDLDADRLKALWMFFESCHKYQNY